MNILYQKALEYSVRGYSVIPLRTNKTPLLKENIIYQRERCATDDEIEKWWKDTPQANIGICTGKISGITVVDIDRGSTDGKQTPLDAFPETYTVETPSGGYQLYYQYDAEIQQTANTFPQFPHVDIRNDGGYVVAPPSHCSYIKYKKKIEGDYKIIKNLPLAIFPRNLFFIKDISRNKVDSILKSLNKMIEGDGRNSALASVIGRVLNIVHFRDHEQIAYPIALAANKQFKQPLSEKEVRTIFDSLHKKEAKKPLVEVEFLKTDKGYIITNEENVLRTIKNDPLLTGQFRQNDFASEVESKYEATIWQPLQKIDIICVQTYLMSTYPHFSKITYKIIEAAILRYAKDNKVNPPLDYMKSIVWDEIPRLDTWLSKAYDVPDDVYHKAVGANFFKGMVKRIAQPACKFDYVLVLEGKQGIKKSTSLAIIGGAWHVETTLTPDTKDFFMIFANKMIIEFSEGETLSRSEVKRLKAVITMQYDRFRLPYERTARDFPRQCIFAMTTNQDMYLKDETGNRRWLPVACKSVDTQWLLENRDQLFAEAYHRVVNLKETVHEFPEKETLEQQEMRQTIDPRVEQIYDWYFNVLTEGERNGGITTRMAYIGGVKGGNTFDKEMGRMEETIIGAILLKNLMLERKRIMDNGARFYRYYPSDETRKISPAKAMEYEDIFNRVKYN